MISGGGTNKVRLVKTREKGMTTIQPKGEHLRQAVKWIGEMRRDEGEKAYPELIRQAAERFNLSPKDEEFLRAFYKREAGE